MLKPTKLALLTALACVSMGTGLAQAQGLPVGPSIVYGSSSNPQTVFSAIGNPAAPAAVMQNGTKKQFRMGVLSFGSSVEFGKVDVEEANNASDDLQALADGTDFDAIDGTDLGVMKQEAVDQINPFFVPLNSLLGNLGRAGDLTAVNAGVQPFTPFVLTLPALGGSLVFDASMEVVVGMKVVNDPFINWTADDIAITGVATLAGQELDKMLDPGNPDHDADAFTFIDAAATDQGVNLATTRTQVDDAVANDNKVAADAALTTLIAVVDGAIADVDAEIAALPGETPQNVIDELNASRDSLVATKDGLTLTKDAVADSATEAEAEAAQVQLDMGTKTPKANVKNDSTLLIRAASIEKIGVGYSRHVWSYSGVANPNFTGLTSGGLSAGVRMKFYRVGLKRHAVRMADGEDAVTQFEDAMSEDLPLSTGFGVDAGVLWTNPKYRVGLWVNNANGPKFKYNQLDLTTYENPNGQIVNSLGAGTTYEMKPQVHMEAAWTPKPNVVVNFTADANESPDPIGRDYQWITASAAYATSSWWIPGVRGGYRKNLVGTELSYGTLGVRWLGVDLDVAAALDSIEVEGDTVPRGMMFYLSSSFTF